MTTCAFVPLLVGQPHSSAQGCRSEAHKQRLLGLAELEGVLHGPQLAVVVKVGGVVRAPHAGPARQDRRVAWGGWSLLETGGQPKMWQACGMGRAGRLKARGHQRVWQGGSVQVKWRFVRRGGCCGGEGGQSWRTRTATLHSASPDGRRGGAVLEGGEIEGPEPGVALDVVHATRQAAVPLAEVHLSEGGASEGCIGYRDCRKRQVSNLQHRYKVCMLRAASGSLHSATAINRSCSQQMCLTCSSLRMRSRAVTEKWEGKVMLPCAATGRGSAHFQLPLLVPLHAQTGVWVAVGWTRKLRVQ